ncbi:MAG TPA: hypothetical protein VHH88_03585, partial [Verrucomicrobiae bacterium]|nr:hypothetical protein [Verrucomicrobiae bacterium]
SPDDSLAGYVVYRAPAPAGPFTRLTSAPVVGTTFSDPDVSAGSYTYMVRAVKLQTTPSGTYYNPSQGAFVSTVVSAITPPILVHAERAGDRLTLSWNSLPGLTYHVEARSNWRTGAWSDASSEITASGATTSWNDNNLGASPQRFYRVVSP